jgi:hypothetical protein
LFEIVYRRRTGRTFKVILTQTEPMPEVAASVPQ